MSIKTQCRDCNKRVPIEDVFSVRRRGGGSYRRPSRTYHSNICKVCAGEIVDHDDQMLLERRGRGPTSSWGFYISDCRRALNRPEPKLDGCPDHEGSCDCSTMRYMS